jgi:signal transduction histidine kinase
MTAKRKDQKGPNQVDGFKPFISQVYDPLARHSIGISGMRDRIRQFGGELNVSRAEPGTLVETKIPLFNSDIGTL